MLSEVMFSNLKSVFIICLLALTIIGCTSATRQNTQVNMREYIHPNGLGVKLNNDFSAKQTSNGFVIEPSDGSNQNVRLPVNLKISLIQGMKPPGDNSLKKKNVGNRMINYRIEKDDGGSGGETYSFTGFEMTDDGFIEYSQSTQSKYSEPDFQTLWQVIENTSFNKNK